MKLSNCVDYIDNDKCPRFCIFCDRYLSYHRGRVVRALCSGGVTALLLSVCWVLFSWFTDMELSIFAVLYGVCISGVILCYSESGPVYQLIATFFTIVGILVADTVVMWFLWDSLFISPEVTKQPSITSIVEMVTYQLKWDPWTWLFMILGVVDGFYIWSSHDE